MKTKITCPNCSCYINTSNAPEAANDNNFVQLPTDEKLIEPEYANELAKRYAGLNIFSRQLPTKIVDATSKYRGAILNHVGMPYPIGVNDVDNAFRVESKRVHGSQEDDLKYLPDFKWVRDFKKRAKKPYVQTVQTRIIPRLRLIFIFLEIKAQQEAKAKQFGGTK